MNKIEIIFSRIKYRTNLILAKKDDVILPLSGETPLDISNSAVIPFDGIALGGDLIALRTSLNPLFLSYQLSGKRKLQIARLAQGKSIVHSNPNLLMNLWIFYPSKNEQNKIAQTLLFISKKIELINRKVKVLKKYRKGLIQIGLKKVYSSTSFIRFSDLYSDISEKNLDSLNQYTVGKDGLKPIPESNYDLCNHKIFYPNCLLIGIGIEEIAVSTKTSGSVSPVYNVYNIKNKHYLNYTQFFLKSILWRKKAFITRKSTRRNYEIDTKELLNFNLPIPIDSQFNIICKSIETLDILIQHFKNKLEQTKAIKSYLLKNMFI